MFEKILFCYDGTAEGRRALKQGADIAVSMRSQTYLLAICQGVVPSTPEAITITPRLMNSEEEVARALMIDGVRRLHEKGLEAEGALVFGDPLTHISETATRIGADLVVLGHRQRGRLVRWWAQSPGEWLMDHLSCSVLVAVAPPEP